VRNVIAVGSGKGGVGKSTTAVNLALAVAASGAGGRAGCGHLRPQRAGDAGLSGRPDSPDNKSIEPMRAFGIEAMSIGLLVDQDTPMIWRGPMATSALTQLLNDTLWGDLDYLFVDLPPGTGDIQLTMAQKIPVAGAVIVTTPQDIATLDASKALKMFEKVQVPVLGIVENMAVHVCSHCGHAEHLFGEGGGERMAAQYGVPLLGSLPLDIGIREQGDAGVPRPIRRRPGYAEARGAWSRCWRNGRARRYRCPPRWSDARDGAALRSVAVRFPAGRCGRVAGPVGYHRRPSRPRPRRPSGQSMSIKSDRWIRRMSEQHGMIEPFEPGQVKQGGGQRIVSYGTSSYGYDVRCAASSRCSPTSTRPSSTRRPSTRAASSTSPATNASSRRTASRWRARWSTSASRATCWWCAWARAPTRAAASSST
jgi:ATP-binding protein involved in chromosome partitioning